MACCLIGATPLPELVLAYFRLGHIHFFMADVDWPMEIFVKKEERRNEKIKKVDGYVVIGRYSCMTTLLIERSSWLMIILRI